MARAEEALREHAWGTARLTPKGVEDAVRLVTGDDRQAAEARQKAELAKEREKPL